MRFEAVVSDIKQSISTQGCVYTKYAVFEQTSAAAASERCSEHRKPCRREFQQHSRRMPHSGQKSVCLRRLLNCVCTCVFMPGAFKTMAASTKGIADASAVCF